MENKSKNPREIAYIVKNSTFAVFDGLSSANIDDGDEPLTLHSKKFSRLSFLIINAEKKATTANINIRDIFGLVERSRFAMREELSRNLHSSDEKELPLAYTVRFTSGRVKGRTAADILLHDGQEGKELLNNQFSFLKSNLQKYPKNQLQIDAIVNASVLAQNNELKEIKESSFKMKLYESGFRPLTRRKNDKGMSFVYEISMEWIFGEQNPINVTIKNYYAPVVENSDGMLNVQVKQRDPDSLQTNTISLSLDDWAYVTHMMEASIERFEAYIYTAKRKEAEKYEYENKSAANIHN